MSCFFLQKLHLRVPENPCGVHDKENMQAEQGELCSRSKCKGIQIDVCIYICIYMYIYICIHMYVYVYVYVLVHLHVHIHIHILFNSRIPKVVRNILYVSWWEDIPGSGTGMLL